MLSAQVGIAGIDEFIDVVEAMESSSAKVSGLDSRSAIVATVAALTASVAASVAARAARTAAIAASMALDSRFIEILLSTRSANALNESAPVNCNIRPANLSRIITCQGHILVTATVVHKLFTFPEPLSTPFFP